MRSCNDVSPCNPLSVWSVGPQIALGTDARKPSEEITCAEAIEAPINRAGSAAAETANNLTRSCFFMGSPQLHVLRVGVGSLLRLNRGAFSQNGEFFSKTANTRFVGAVVERCSNMAWPG